MNDFNRFGRTWRVFVQAEQEYRETPRGVDSFYVRTSGGDMVPLSTLVSVKRMSGPEVIYRYNRFRASKITGQNSLGYSSGPIGERNGRDREGQYAGPGSAMNGPARCISRS